MQILDEIVAGRSTLTEIAESIGVHKSTVSRLLTTLVKQHFVYRSDDSRFHLGRKIFELAHHTIEHPNARALALPLMRLLSQRTGCPSYLAQLDHDHVVILAVETAGATSDSQAAGVRSGDRLPWASTAAGRILVADRPRGDGTPGAPDGTDAELKQQMEQAGPRGFIRMTDDARTTIAAPIRGFDEAPVASIALVVPEQLTDVSIRPYLAELLHAAGEASRALGWRPE